MTTFGESEPCFLVEGPRWGDAEFYAEWLSSAAKAEELRVQAFEDENFNKRITTVCVGYIPDFCLGASALLMRFKEHRSTFTILFNTDRDLDDGADFVMMLGMGFFELTGQRYQMIIPSPLTLETVKAAMIKFANTEDDCCTLHPEDLAVTMPHAQLRNGSAIWVPWTSSSDVPIELHCSPTVRGRAAAR
jgi:hypothetical protein